VNETGVAFIHGTADAAPRASTPLGVSHAAAVRTARPRSARPRSAPR